jgi:hypothetical protein
MRLGKNFFNDFPSPHTEDSKASSIHDPPHAHERGEPSMSSLPFVLSFDLALKQQATKRKFP